VSTPEEHRRDHKARRRAHRHPRLLELARYCRAVLQAYLEGESEDPDGLVKWIDHEIEAVVGVCAQTTRR
jgi:hypothetical protein